MAQYVQLQNGLIIPEAEFAEREVLGRRPSMMEIATTSGGRDITRGYINDKQIMAAGDTVLAMRGGDYAVYDDIARDDQVKTCRQQRELALIGKEWFVDPGDSSRKAKKAADRLSETLRNLEWDIKTLKMLSGVLYGFAVGEVMWATDGNEITVSDLKVRNRARFGFLPSGELRLKTFSDQLSGEKLPPAKFWAYSCGADHDDEPYGLGLGHFLYWPVFFKKNGIKFWLQFLEKFGQPTAVGKYPSNTTDAEKNKLLKALASIQSSTAIRIPEGMIVELLEAKRGGTADYTALYDRMNAAIAKVYLGHTGSTDATPGRLGGEDTASEVRADLIKADADLICGSFNRTLARWLTYYNDGADVAPPRVWRKVAPPEDLQASASKDRTLFDMGFKPTLKYINDTYGEGYEEKPAPAPGAGAERPISLTAIREQGAVPAGFAEDSPGEQSEFTGTDAQAEQLARDAAQAGKSMLDAIRAKVDAASSLEQLRDDLLHAFGDLDETDLVNVMTMAFAAADLSGRFDVSEGD